MRYRIFSLSLAWFGAICNELPRVTVKFIKKISNILLKKLLVTRNALHYGLFMLKWEKMYDNTCGNALKLWLHVAYGLFMFVEFEKFPDPSVIPISVRFHNLSHLLLSMVSSLNSASTNVQI